MDIDWQKQRTVVEATESGEHYVKVSGGYMLAQDYTGEGGRVEDEVGATTVIGRMTNAALSNLY